MQLVPEELKDFLQRLLIADEFSALLDFDLHKLVDLVFPLHVFLELELEIIDLVLSGFLLRLH